MAGLREQEALRSNIGPDGRPLSAQERERLLQPYLPAASPGKQHRTQPLRQLIKAALHLLLYNLIHLAFSVYHRFRVAYHNLIDRIFAILYYHHRTPEYIQKDVHRLKKVPKHLSIILELDDNTRDNSSLETLIHNVCEVAAWSACAGVPLLSIYEPSGTTVRPSWPRPLSNLFQVSSSSPFHSYTAVSHVPWQLISVMTTQTSQPFRSALLTCNLSRRLHRPSHPSSPTLPNRLPISLSCFCLPLTDVVPSLI
jgi:hypothetical protein